MIPCLFQSKSELNLQGMHHPIGCAGTRLGPTEPEPHRPPRVNLGGSFPDSLSTQTDFLPNPHLRRLAEHHAADPGQRQHYGQDIGLRQHFGQDIKRSGYAPKTADDTGPDCLGRPTSFQFFYVNSPKKARRCRG